MAAILESSRLLLRPITLEDYRVRFDILSDPEGCRLMGTDPHENPDVIKNRIEAYQKLDEINFAHHWTLTSKVTGEALGFCDVYLPSPHLRCLGVCEVAFGLHPDFRRVGYMAEALRACLSHMIHREKFFRIEASVNPINHHSRLLLARLGFKVEGVQRQKWLWAGRRHDMLAYSLLADELQTV